MSEHCLSGIRSDQIIVIIIIIQHLYSTTVSYWDTEALMAPVKTMCEQVGFEFALESLQNMTGSNVSRQRSWRSVNWRPSWLNYASDSVRDRRPTACEWHWIDLIGKITSLSPRLAASSNSLMASCSLSLPVGCDASWKFKTAKLYALLAWLSLAALA